MAFPPVTFYRTPDGPVAQRGGEFFHLPELSWNSVFRQADAAGRIATAMAQAKAINPPVSWLPPIENQEVWAAGVTYLRSRDARIDESKDAGGGDFYDRVYAAERPEIFFKATPHRVVGHGGVVQLRRDSRWNVPEPEVTLAINAQGQIFGYTVGNDMSSRDIEGENPLYLPQAKVYGACCSLGPGLVIRETLPRETPIRLAIARGGATVVKQETSLSQMKRTFEELVEFLYRDNDFPEGCYLMTGTGIVPDPDFTLKSGDEIRIEIEGLGILANAVA